eukprot:comp16656_c0_seq1/m.26921 comp16656_c0_seq1/g.26921  ORF comp16656_c0_seq1/g.26921 comp16656_c0_seq1/m.26921 type:complete len:276 (+) comp16656_c0_seq1:3-830(+)
MLHLRRFFASDRLVKLQAITKQLEKVNSGPATQKELFDALSLLATTNETKAIVKECQGKQQEIDNLLNNIAKIKTTQPDFKFWEDNIPIAGVVSAYKNAWTKITAGKPLQDGEKLVAQYRAFTEEWSKIHERELSSLSGSEYVKAVEEKLSSLSSKYPLLGSNLVSKVKGYNPEQLTKDRQIAFAGFVQQRDEVEKTLKSERDAAVERGNALRAKIAALQKDITAVSTTTMEEWVNKNPAVAKMIWEELEAGDYSWEITEAKRAKYLEVLKNQHL